MTKDNKLIKEKMEKQQKIRQEEGQYDSLIGLGWKNVGILLLVLIMAIVVYSIFFR